MAVVGGCGREFIPTGRRLMGESALEKLVGESALEKLKVGPFS